MHCRLLGLHGAKADAAEWRPPPRLVSVAPPDAGLQPQRAPRRLGAVARRAAPMTTRCGLLHHVLAQEPCASLLRHACVAVQPTGRAAAGTSPAHAPPGNRRALCPHHSGYDAAQSHPLPLPSLHTALAKARSGWLALAQQATGFARPFRCPRERGYLLGYTSLLAISVARLLQFIQF